MNHRKRSAPYKKDAEHLYEQQNRDVSTRGDSSSVEALERNKYRTRARFMHSLRRGLESHMYLVWQSHSRGDPYENCS